MATNWPPATAPAWPPTEYKTDFVSFSDWKILAADLKKLGFSQSVPTQAERRAYFNNALCDWDDSVVGRILVSPSGVRYPFAVCQNPAHRQLLVLWYPYTCSVGSGEE